MRVKKKAVKMLATALIVTTMASNTAYAANWTQNPETGLWYHYNDENVLTTGWLQDMDSNWYFLIEDGKMLSDTWYQDMDGKWYYFSAPGAMLVNTWHKNTDDKWYYLGANGAMLLGCVTPDGYTLNADGSWNESVAKKTVTSSKSGGSGGGSGGGGSGGGGGSSSGNSGSGSSGGSEGKAPTDDGSTSVTPDDNPNPPTDDSKDDTDKATSSDAKVYYSYSIHYKDVDSKTILSEVVGRAEKDTVIEIEHFDIEGYLICDNQTKTMVLTSDAKTVNIYYAAVENASPSDALQINWEVRFVDAETRQKVLSPTRQGKIQDGGDLYVNYLSKIVDGTEIWLSVEEPPMEITVYGPGDQIYYIEYELSGSLSEDDDLEKEVKERLQEWIDTAKEYEASITGENAESISTSRFVITDQNMNDTRVRSMVGQLNDTDEYVFYIIGKNFKPNGLVIPNAYDNVVYSDYLEDTITIGGDVYYIVRMSIERSYDPDTCSHMWSLTIDNEARCLERGTQVYECERCGTTMDTYTAALGHVDSDNDSVCDRCNQRTFDQTIGSEIQTALSINGTVRSLTYICIDEDYQGGMLYISKEALPLTDFGGCGSLDYDDSNVRRYFHLGFQNDFSIIGSSLMPISRSDSIETDYAVVLTEAEVDTYASLIPATSTYLVRGNGSTWIGVNEDQSKNLVSNPDLDSYGIRPAIILAKPEAGIPDSVHWKLGDIQARDIDGVTYMFQCIDQNYSDRTENHRQAALFLCTSVIPANIGSGYEYEEQLDGSYEYMFKAGPIVNFGDYNDYKYSNVRKWLEKSTSNFYNTENISIGVDYAYMGSTGELRYSDLNEDGLKAYYIGNQKLTGKLFILSIDEALKYKDYLWKFNGSDEENPESQYGSYSKAYWLRNPMGTAIEYIQTKQVYVVDLVNGNIHPNAIKPDATGDDAELDVTGTVGVRPAFAMPQD